MGIPAAKAYGLSAPIVGRFPTGMLRGRQVKAEGRGTDGGASAWRGSDKERHSIGTRLAGLCNVAKKSPRCQVGSRRVGRDRLAAERIDRSAHAGGGVFDLVAAKKSLDCQVARLSRPGGPVFTRPSIGPRGHLSLSVISVSLCFLLPEEF